ncbi:hypothetical protein GCM10023336_00970 [Streptomyces similanensis]|uniref:Uncharacterized protein n=1 Tax=Streptomyces similanensis TaxID=1274988 RepID=A0ABP9JR45_9ACTN
MLLRASAVPGIGVHGRGGSRPLAEGASERVRGRAPAYGNVAPPYGTVAPPYGSVAEACGSSAKAGPVTACGGRTGLRSDGVGQEPGRAPPAITADGAGPGPAGFRTVAWWENWVW